jgi:Ca2+-binding EF-hand superfamily protein
VRAAFEHFDQKRKGKLTEKDFVRVAEELGEDA